MENKKLLTPPHHGAMEPKEIPDYFCGRLIFTDDTNGMRHVVYDGHSRHQFASRAAAERWCIEQAGSVENDALAELMRAQAHAEKAAKILRTANERYPYERSVDIEAISVNIRKMADAIDTIISQYII